MLIGGAGGGGHHRILVLHINLDLFHLLSLLVDLYLLCHCPPHQPPPPHPIRKRTLTIPNRIYILHRMVVDEPGLGLAVFVGDVLNKFEAEAVSRAVAGGGAAVVGGKLERHCEW